MCAVVAALTTAIAGHAAAPVRLVVNGKTLAAEAHLIEGSAYLPLRATATALGAQLEWVAERKMVTLCIAGKCSPVRVSDPASGAQIIQGRTFVPLRTVAEAFGCEVEWQPKGRAVSVTASRQ